MNTALYPGTLGYFLRTMIGEVASDATLDDAARRSSSGRSPAGDRWPRSASETSPTASSSRVRPPRAAPAGPRLTARSSPWKGSSQRRGTSGPIGAGQLARLGATANGSADLLRSWPSARPADYFQRIATTYDHLSNLGGFQTGGDRMDEVFDAMFAGSPRAHARRPRLHGARERRHRHKPYPLLFQLIYQRHQTRIPPTSLIDGQPFSETEPIKPYERRRPRTTSTGWPQTPAAQKRCARRLRRRADADSLLYMLLRHALLIQAGTSVNRWLELFDIEAPELVISRKFLGHDPRGRRRRLGDPAAPASAVSGTVASDLPLLAMVHCPNTHRYPRADRRALGRNARGL